MKTVGRRFQVSTALVLALFGLTISASVWCEKHYRRRADAVRHGLSTLTAQAEEMRRERDRLNAQADSAQRELAALAATVGESRGDSAVDSELQPWLGRLKQLKQLFAHRPDQRIPELQFLNEGDWLWIAKIQKLDTEEQVREALAKARNDARWIFARRMVDALSQYKKAFNNELPPTTLALAPYFTPPIDPRILQRYEMVASGKVQSGRGGAIVAIREKTPIDPEYDNRVRVNANGGMSSGSPLDWVPGYSERRLEAYHKYANDNSGASPQDMASLLPYFSPPLDGATREKVLRVERRH